MLKIRLFESAKIHQVKLHCVAIIHSILNSELEIYLFKLSVNIQNIIMVEIATILYVQCTEATLLQDHDNLFSQAKRKCSILGEGRSNDFHQRFTTLSHHIIGVHLHPHLSTGTPFISF